jgi:RNase P subunit RPR2
MIECKACRRGRLIEDESMRHTIQDGRGGNTTYLYYTCNKCGAKRTNYIDHGDFSGHGSFWKDGHVDDAGQEIVPGRKRRYWREQSEKNMTRRKDSTPCPPDARLSQRPWPSTSGPNGCTKTHRSNDARHTSRTSRLRAIAFRALAGRISDVPE